MRKLTIFLILLVAASAFAQPRKKIREQDLSEPLKVKVQAYDSVKVSGTLITFYNGGSALSHATVDTAFTSDDTTELKAATSNDGNYHYLKQLAGGNSNGGGWFQQMDSAFSEDGWNAFDNATAGKQWVRYEVANKLYHAGNRTNAANAKGNTRGENATDFQLIRSADNEVAAGNNSFIAGGQNNRIGVNVTEAFATGSGVSVRDDTSRAGKAFRGFAQGNGTQVRDWYGASFGAGTIVDGKISFGAGNNTVASSNDGAAIGNRVVSGRRRFPVDSSGVDTDVDVGTKPYVWIPDSLSNVAAFGDARIYFPNFTNTADSLTEWYGAGSSIDVWGNVLLTFCKNKRWLASSRADWLTDF